MGTIFSQHALNGDYRRRNLISWQLTKTMEYEQILTLMLVEPWDDALSVAREARSMLEHLKRYKPECVEHYRMGLVIKAREFYNETL